MKTFFMYVLALALPTAASSQSILSNTTPFENGNQITYAFKDFRSGKTSELSYFVDEINDTSFVARFKKGELVIPIKSPRPGTVGDEVCLGNFEKCSFDPPMKLFDKNIKVGDEWSQSFKVLGETFSSDAAQEVKVTKQEKIKIQIGEFDAFKIVAKAKFKGATTKGETFSGNETIDLWVGNVSNKTVLLKMNFSNSFQDRWSIELTHPLNLASTPLK